MLVHFMVLCSWLKGFSYGRSKLPDVLVAFMIVFSSWDSFPPSVLHIFHVCSFSRCWSFPNVFELFLELLLGWFLMIQTAPALALFFGVYNGHLPDVDPLLGVFGLPLMLFLFMVWFSMNHPPPPLSLVFAMVLLGVGPFLVLVLFLVLFILLVMNWTPPFSSILNDLLPSASPLHGVLELPLVLFLSLV